MLEYKRTRFGTRLPEDILYTRSHYWLRQHAPGLWRVGFTKFAVRMLGDLVEFQFEPLAETTVGARIGWIEGFKAISDIYSVAAGRFLGPNPALAQDITLLESDPYGHGWLYSVEGHPEPDAVDVHGYVSILDATIDKMLANRHEEKEQ